MSDKFYEIHDKIDRENLLDLDFTFSVTVEEAALACVGITMVLDETSDKVDIEGCLVSQLKEQIEYVENVISNGNDFDESIEQELLLARKQLIEGLSIYFQLKKAVNKDKVPSPLLLDKYQTLKTGVPYLTKQSVHDWADKNLKKRLVGWGIETSKSSCDNSALVNVQLVQKSMSITSTANTQCVIAAIISLWMAEGNMPAGLIKGEMKLNYSALAEKLAKRLESLGVHSLSVNTIRQLISISFKENKEVDKTKLKQEVIAALETLEDKME